MPFENSLLPFVFFRGVWFFFSFSSFDQHSLYGFPREMPVFTSPCESGISPMMMASFLASPCERFRRVRSSEGVARPNTFLIIFGGRCSFSFEKFLYSSRPRVCEHKLYPSLHTLFCLVCPLFFFLSPPPSRTLPRVVTGTSKRRDETNIDGCFFNGNRLALRILLRVQDPAYASPGTSHFSDFFSSCPVGFARPSVITPLQSFPNPPAVLRINARLPFLTITRLFLLPTANINLPHDPSPRTEKFYFPASLSCSLRDLLLDFCTLSL